MYKQNINHSAITALTDYVGQSATQINTLTQKINGQESQLVQLNQRLADVMSNHEHYVTELNAEHAKKLATEIGAIEKSLNATIVDTQQKLSDSQQLSAEKLSLQKNDYEQKLQTLAETHAVKLSERVAEYEQKITELTAQYEEKILALTQNVERLSVSNEAMIRRIRGLE